VVDHDAARTGLLRELECLGLARALVLHADVGQLAEVAGAFAVLVLDGADEHAEAWLEGCDLGGLRGIKEGIGHVVYHLEQGFRDMAEQGGRVLITMPPFVFSMPC